MKSGKMDMKKKEIIEREIQKTLDCFGQLDKLTAGPYFYTRLQARLEARPGTASLRPGWSGRLVWRPVLIGLIIVLNLTTAALVFFSHEQNKESTQASLTTLAAEYDLNQDYSDLFTANP
jgi:hypothetical protein